MPRLGCGLAARSGDDGGVDEEELLSGGNNSLEIVRVDDTVRRARDSGSGFAARVLAFLETAGYPSSWRP
jgi:hypothetical protein